jgi:hypothetical protein
VKTLFKIDFDELSKVTYPTLAKHFTSAELVELGESKSGAAINYHVRFHAINRNGNVDEPHVMLTRNKNSNFVWLLPDSPSPDDTWKAYRCRPSRIGMMGIGGLELSRLCLEAYVLCSTLGISLLDQLQEGPKVVPAEAPVKKAAVKRTPKAKTATA